MHLTAVSATICAVIAFLLAIATQKTIFVDAVIIQPNQAQFDHEIEIEKQKIIELPLLVQITPKQNEKPQLLIIEIRLPDQPTSPYRSTFITHQLPKQSIAANGNDCTTSPIGTSPVSGLVSPYQGAVNVGSAATYTNGHLTPPLFHSSDKPPPYQGLALSFPVNPSGSNVLLSPQPSHISQPQAPSLSNTGSPISSNPSNTIPSTGFGTFGSLANTIDIRTPNAGNTAFTPQYNHALGSPINTNQNAPSLPFPQQNPLNTGFGGLTPINASPPAPPNSGFNAPGNSFGSNGQGFGAFAAIAPPNLAGNRLNSGPLPFPQAPRPPPPAPPSFFGSPTGILPQPQAPPIPGTNPNPSINISPSSAPSSPAINVPVDGTLDNRIQPNVLKSTVG